MRYHTGLRFDIEPEDNRYLKVRAINEHREGNEEFSVGHRVPGRRQSQYYELVFSLGDLFNRGTNVALMFAQKELCFGSNGLGENLAGINLFGYESCGYLTSRMPTADIAVESGIRIVQDIYRSELFVAFMFLRGEAIPDRTISNHPSSVYRDQYYIYEQSVVRLDWYPRPNASVYLEHEQTNFLDSSKGLNIGLYSQYFLVTNKVGARFAF
jgi:hypothetical protein